ncbi:MAG: helix-turn-helix transcriptional regulator [Sediminibacterium sp.]
MERPLNKLFGDLLKELRAKANLSQEMLAIESELDRSYISMLERGLRKPTIDTLFKIARPLKTSPSQIIKILESRYENS